MSQIRNALLRGGSDVMVVTRLYRIGESLVCNLRNPSNGDFFFKVPVLSNLGAVIDAPSESWHKTQIPWSDLPRVLVSYRSSKEQGLPLPVVVGVVSNGASKVVADSSTAAPTQRPSNPGPNDASIATANSKVIARSDGAIDIISSEELVVRTKKILLSAGVEPTKSVAIAEELADSLEPLYDAVNKLLQFASSFPSKLTIASKVGAEPLTAVVTATMDFSVTGVSATTQSPIVAAPVSESFLFTPFDGPSNISVPAYTEYDSPNITVSPRD